MAQPATPDRGAATDQFSACANATASLALKECAALVALYTQTGGANWTESGGWLAEPNPCDWHGVTCESRTSGSGPAYTVVRLELDSNGLKGAIPSELGDLTSLRVLDLQDNQLSGAPPASLGQLSRLQWLSLSRNQLSGPLPNALGQLSSLEELYFFDNQFTGTLPASLGQLSHLTSLAADSNQFTGEVPAALGQLSNLEWLWLGNNRFSGELPDIFDQLPHLISLDAGLNQLSGPLPPSLMQLSNLKNLSLENNQFSGPLPASLGQLANLEWLSLHSNRLAGPLPASLGQLSKLRYLWLDGNQFTGLLPAALGNLSSLEELYVGGNPFSGSVPHALMGLPKLKTFWFYDATLCRPPDAAFATWLASLETWHNSPVCGTSLAASATDGAPGSRFAFRGVALPPNTTATITVNGQALGSTTTDAFGELAFTLDAAAADEGRYDIAVAAGSTLSLTIRLRANWPAHSAAPEGKLFSLTGGTGIPQHYLYMPAALGP